MLKLTLRAPSTIPLELDGITPERVASLSPLEVAKPGGEKRRGGGPPTRRDDDAGRAVPKKKKGGARRILPEDGEEDVDIGEIDDINW